MLPKPCKCKGKEVRCTKTEVKFDTDGMVPLSVVSFDGKPFGEIRRLNLPRELFKKVIASLEVFHKEGFDTVEYTDDDNASDYDLTLVKQGKRHSYTFHHKSVTKKPYLDLLCAIESLHAHIEQKSKKSAVATLRTAK